MNKAAAMQLAAKAGAAGAAAAQGLAGTAAIGMAYLGASGSDPPRGGLQKFIQEIRDCPSKEAEQARVDRELANVRAKFSSTGGLNSYKKKKYVWKLVYIFMLGYEVEFGHMEMISLISSTKYSEKAVGYIAVSLLLRSGDEMMTLVINSMRNDLLSHSNPSQTLALATIANLGGADLREGLFADVQKLLLRSETDASVRKKAALCLLRFFRESPSNATLVSHPVAAANL
jgi:AP-2 complex subunit alpha